MNKGAVFSEDRAYRYLLWRIWDERKPYALFIGLNPSTADRNRDDPTIRRCGGFASSWGYGGFYMGNLFGLVTTDPLFLKVSSDPIGDNDDYLIPTALEAGIVIAAWGCFKEVNGRDQDVMQKISLLHHLGLTKDGYPRHPLYLRSDTKPTPLGRRCRISRRCYDDPRRT